MSTPFYVPEIVTRAMVAEGVWCGICQTEEHCSYCEGMYANIWRRITEGAILRPATPPTRQSNTNHSAKWVTGTDQFLGDTLGATSHPDTDRGPTVWLHGLSGTIFPLTPGSARELADALHAAADHAERNQPS